MNKFDTLFDAWGNFCDAANKISASEMQNMYDKIGDECSPEYDEEKSMMLHCIMQALEIN